MYTRRHFEDTDIRLFGFWQGVVLKKGRKIIPALRPTHHAVTTGKKESSLIAQEERK